MTGQQKSVDKNKRPRGRPRTGRGHQINLMVNTEMRDALRTYIEDRGGGFKATEAIRRLLLESLGSKGCFR